MALSYLQAPIPKWVLMDNYGEAAGGAKLYTYRSLNKTEPKNVYQDPGGTLAWSNPILFDLNGTQGPFYWEVDSLDLDETYYLEAYDSDDNLLWTVDDFYPPGSGGGGNVTTYVPVVNYITNNQFIDHIDDTSIPTNTTDLVIAPSNHKGFTPALQNPVVGTYGVVGPDIRFVKKNTNATDQITFPVFPLGTTPFTGSVTPVDYVRYQCTNSPAGEDYKCFQFPITQKVQNLSNNSMTFGIWAAVAATPADIKIYVRQYFGSGTAASAEVRLEVASFTLSTTWDYYSINFSIPSVAGKSLGSVGQQTNDDALYIQVGMPLGSPCDIFFTKPALYLGNINPDLDFDSYDQIDSISQTPRTGDIRVSYWASKPLGWVPMDDNTIGNVGSGATRANQDTFQLYKTLWDAVSNTYAPVSTGRGASAIADFIAGKTLTLPRALGRALAEAGAGAGLTATALGQWSGSEINSVTLVAANLPPHSHTYSFITTDPIPGAGTNNAASNRFIPTSGNTGNGPGTSTPVNVPSIQPTTYMNYYIKL